jgi:hypothetical protein
MVRRTLDSAAWRCDQRHLIEVIDYCEENKLIDCHAENSNISNLRVILPEARRAMKENNCDRLESLFFHADKLTNAELRLWIGSAHREAVTALKQGNCILITLSQEQFQRIQRSTRIKFAFA